MENAKTKWKMNGVERSCGGDDIKGLTVLLRNVLF